MQKIIFEVDHNNMETDFVAVHEDPLRAWHAASRLQQRMRRGTIQHIQVTVKVS